MKRTTLAIFLISIIALSISTWIIYNQYIKLNQINSPNFKITAFSMDKAWEYPVGLILDCWFNITLHNMGVNDVDELKLLVQMFVNDSKIEVINSIHGVSDNGSITKPLLANEVREIRGELLSSVKFIGNIGGHPNGASYVAKVMIGDNVLDERWATFPV